jgi:hypothetical protein
MCTGDLELLDAIGRGMTCFSAPFPAWTKVSELKTREGKPVASEEPVALRRLHQPRQG